MENEGQGTSSKTSSVCLQWWLNLATAARLSIPENINKRDRVEIFVLGKDINQLVEAPREIIEADRARHVPNSQDAIF